MLGEWTKSMSWKFSCAVGGKCNLQINFYVLVLFIFHKLPLPKTGRPDFFFLRLFCVSKTERKIKIKTNFIQFDFEYEKFHSRRLVSMLKSTRRIKNILEFCSTHTAQLWFIFYFSLFDFCYSKSTTELEMLWCSLYTQLEFRVYTGTFHKYTGTWMFPCGKTEMMSFPQTTFMSFSLYFSVSKNWLKERNITEKVTNTHTSFRLAVSYTFQ